MNYEFTFSLEPSVSGCMNPTASNYDPNANTPSGSDPCECASDKVEVSVALSDSTDAGIGGSGQLSNADNTEVIHMDYVDSGSDGSEHMVCATPGETYTFSYDIALDPDFANFGYELTVPNGATITSDDALSQEAGTGTQTSFNVAFQAALPVLGCMNPSASNLSLIHI